MNVVWLFAALLIVSGCASAEPAWKRAVAGDGPGDVMKLSAGDVVVSDLPKSRSGNRSQYTVFGVQYDVLESAEGFTESGQASWYGSKFHGRPTASGEIYDMHELTAAHKHLPLPTFVRVTRIDTGQSVVVRVNDRGPFVEDRIIDLSYAAAARLDMLEGGKAEVQVQALSRVPPESRASASAPAPAPAPASTSASASSNGLSFIQVGAFGKVGNANALMERIGGVTNLPIKVDYVESRQVHRVLVGPLENDDAALAELKRLEGSGIRGFSLAQ